ncbi:dioxygenase [Sphingobium amiense]|uniref:Dioxygenase n=1 Tax=Sphingobium amiense TaxID=135719 RepID=A0A494WG47_9SPHN|nr:carotenoid oxygenase family protein [Sphingobium amiense]BBD99972.1 dioxygenase [Sphingobium amiense]
MADFSKMKAAQGFFSPQRYEADILDCETTGSIPAELEGAFVRLGGEWFYPPKYQDDAILNSDGHVSSFRFKNGRVSYKSRFVRTPRFEANLKAGSQQFGYYRNPFTDEPSVKNLDRTVANTTPFAFAGRLMALKEDGLPHLIDPNSLETVGRWNFDGKYKGPHFTAHPKVDSETGEMIAYGNEANGLAGDAVYVATIDKTGRVTHDTSFTVPYVSIMHDIALTEKHIIFPFGGYVTSMERLKEGKIHWGWDNSKESYIGILPRGADGKDIRWFKGPLRCMMHTFHARTVGNKVIMEAPFYDGNFFPFFHNVDNSPWARDKAKGYLRRLTFDLNSKHDGWKEEIVFQTPIVDIGAIDRRFLTRDLRYVFTGFTDPSKPFNVAAGGNLQGRITNCYGRFDVKSGKMEAMFAGDTHSLAEACFVPRKGGDEGVGWLMGVASNFAEMRSELVIADAQRLADGPIARVILPFRAAPQVHGTWVGAQELPFV